MYVGLVTAFMRLIMLILVLLFAIFRIDQTAVPQWVYNVLNMDAINNAFLGNVYMYHCHNHPINVTFKLYMENFSKNLRSLTQEKYDLPKKNFEEKSIFYLNLIKKKNYLRDKIQMARLLSMDKDKEMLLKDARVKAILKKKMEEELKGKEIKKTENNSKLEENVKENENKYL
jgi:HD superfamily phosphohydrolase